MRTEAAKIEVAAHVIFGEAGNAVQYQVSGWSMPETGYTWAVGTESRVRIPYGAGRGRLVIELTASPFLVKHIVSEQPLSLAINGTSIGTEMIAGESTIGFVVPPEAIGDSGVLDLTLSYPKAVRPSELGVNLDERTLGFAVRDILVLWTPPEAPFTPTQRAPLPSNMAGGMEAAIRFCTALSPIDLMGKFQSLGHNCEFGLAQRAVGAEPLGLLRFAGIPIPSLLRGLDLAFEGIDEPAHLHFYTDPDRTGGEYLVYNDRYAVEFHTDELQGKTTPEALVAKLTLHLKFLRRHFEEVLGAGRQIFVVHGPGIRTAAQVSPILTLLSSHGPNTLLYVTADATMPAGTVVQERADLFHGYIQKFAPLHAMEQFDVIPWLSICANTYRLWREQGGGAEEAVTVS